MKASKIIGIVLLVIVCIFMLLCTIYFLFANAGYGIEVFTELFSDGFFAGIKNFFVDIWNGFKYVFKA